MKTRLDMNKIAKGLGARRRGKATASGGYFGAMQLVASLLEKTPNESAKNEAEELVSSRRRASRWQW
jgi:hypothetical protein